MNKNNILFFLLVLVVWGCKSDSDDLAPVDYNKIRYVLADNYNLNVFGRIVRACGLEGELSKDGDFTLLVPSNAALLAAGYDTTTVHTLPKATLAALVEYHLLDGNYEFNKLPLGFNHELKSRGGKIFVTRWAKDGDTTMTVNGKKIVPPINYQTNNGLIQILDVALQPSQHKTILDALASRQDLVLFSHIVQRSGMKDLLSAEEQFTLFAPTNAAVKTFGLSSLQEIDAADPDYLAEIVGYHLLSGKRYHQDFILALPTPTTPASVLLYTGTTTATSWGLLYEQTAYMYDGNRVKQSIRKGTIYGTVNREVTQFTLTDAKSNDSYIVDTDLVAENGVLHTVNRVMQYK
ncbi:fasciclin domain-containing protein [Sphingobacterium sp. LRF_L2]|uniref:fasciclin domain-containing protein n=1 Tax=Sphingobacterium sp. LRF_L2 TaxID=3369421 RepID=UPI003F6163A0